MKNDNLVEKLLTEIGRSTLTIDEISAKSGVAVSTIVGWLYGGIIPSERKANAVLVAITK
ncbi:MAG: hypothetical protein RR338_02975 [Clostridia bacterium]